MNIQNECVICCKEIEIIAVGTCDHMVCHICITRMRALCNQNECPICRNILEQVTIIVRKIRKPKPYKTMFQKHIHTSTNNLERSTIFFPF